jgi:hypothetical protein
MKFFTRVHIPVPVWANKQHHLVLLALGTYIDAQYMYLRIQSGFTLICDARIALGPRLEQHPMAVDNRHPLRGTSQFLVRMMLE